MKNFKSRLRDSMKRFDLESVADLAKFAHVGWSTANQWLAGSIPRKLALYDLASRLEVTAEWLKTGAGDKEPVNLKDVQSLRNHVCENLDHTNVVCEDSPQYAPKPSVLVSSNSLDATALADLLATLIPKLGAEELMQAIEVLNEKKPQGWESLSSQAIGLLRQIFSQQSQRP